MVNGMANRETSELGGEGVLICPEGLISKAFTPVLSLFFGGGWVDVVM
jgi:hypothetical protein